MNATQEVERARREYEAELAEQRWKGIWELDPEDVEIYRQQQKEKEKNERK